MYTIYRNIEGGGVEAHLNFPRPHLLLLERTTNHNLVNFRVYLLPFGDLTHRNTHPITTVANRKNIGNARC